MIENTDFITPLKQAVDKIANNFKIDNFNALPDSPFGTTNFFLKAHLIIIIGIIGPCRGRIMFSFNNNMSEELTKNMTGSNEINKELMYSACQEFTNMVCGATICNKSMDSNIDITPPTVIFSNKMFISSMGTPIHLVPFEINSKRLNVLISVK